jgi:hypothetical protein
MRKAAIFVDRNAIDRIIASVLAMRRSAVSRGERNLSVVSADRGVYADTVADAFGVSFKVAKGCRVRLECDDIAVGITPFGKFNRRVAVVRADVDMPFSVVVKFLRAIERFPFFKITKLARNIIFNEV